MTFSVGSSTPLISLNDFQVDRELLAVGLKDYYTGHDAQNKRGMLNLSRPVQRGVVSDWEATERIWWSAFDQLDTSPTDQPVLLTDPSLNPTATREAIAQVNVNLTVLRLWLRCGFA